MNEFLIVTIGYALSFGMGVGLLWFFQSTFFLSFLKVKASRGKKILVKVRSPIQDYYTAGEVDSDGLLRFKDLDGEELYLDYTNKALYRTLNVNAVDVDMEAKTLVGRDFQHYSGYDPKKFTQKLKRALQKPGELKTEERILLILVVVAAGLSAFTLFLVFNMSTQVDLLVQNMNSAVQVVAEIN